jgi:hypothetical protein
MRGVLGVLRAEGVDRGASLRGVVGEAGAAVPAKPSEVGPVLTPAVNEDRDLRPPLDVADPGEGARIGRLGLLVDRGVQGRFEDHEADRHEAGTAVLGDRAQGRRPCPLDEGALGVGQDGAAGTRLRQRSPPRCFH